MNEWYNGKKAYPQRNNGKYLLIKGTGYFSLKEEYQKQWINDYQFELFVNFFCITSSDEIEKPEDSEWTEIYLPYKDIIFYKIETSKERDTIEFLKKIGCNSSNLKDFISEEEIYENGKVFVFIKKWMWLH